MSRRLVLGGLLLSVSAGLTPAAAESWLHVHVEEAGEAGQTVSVNVPLSLIESVLPLIDHEPLKDGRVKIPDGLAAGEVDLRGIWEAVRATKDGEFVRVQGHGENLRVAKAQGMLVVEAREDGERVNVRLPLEVADALFSGGADELDVVGALRVLARFPDHDLVTVEDGATKVRVWVDDRQEMKR